MPVWVAVLFKWLVWALILLYTLWMQTTVYEVISDWFAD